MLKLSVVLAVRNEEANIGRCLGSVKSIADEIVVVDEQSDDRTVEIAKSYGAKVFEHKHEAIFHLTKQVALNHASGEWILQLDADEVVTPELAREIKNVIEMSRAQINGRVRDIKKWKLFQRHQAAVEKRDGRVGKESGDVVAFFIPRVNMFLGKPLIHAGVYPDGVIRLVKNGKARFPSKSVHEQIEVDGEVSWLNNDLEHYDSPTLERYWQRADRYTDLTASEYRAARVGKDVFSFLYYMWLKPFIFFLKLFFRHKGFLDGYRGFLWSLFSGLHFPIAYWKYLKNNE